MMGGGLDSPIADVEGKKEVLLCLIPWPEPTAILDGIRKQFPNLEVEYINAVPNQESWDLHGGIPDGMFSYSLTKSPIFLFSPISYCMHIIYVHLRLSSKLLSLCI
jgi:hypothetical protein